MKRASASQDNPGIMHDLDLGGEGSRFPARLMFVCDDSSLKIIVAHLSLFFGFFLFM